jgi:hypothetical protein
VKLARGQLNDVPRLGRDESLLQSFLEILGLAALPHPAIIMLAITAQTAHQTLVRFIRNLL